MTKARELADVIGTQSTTENVLQGRRNLIINGAMQVAQRGTSVTISNAAFGLDRFKIYNLGIDNLVGTITQESDAPNGFSNSLKITTTTAETSIASGDYSYITQFIEAQDLQHLAFGTSDAKPITLSFWIKSSQTGVFGVSLYTQDNDGIANSTYTINAASTWEYKTITFTGDTSRAINNDNGIGMYVSFHLAAGSTFTSDTTDESFEVYTNAKWAGGHAQNGVITTANATWQITGVQLEVGSVATPFEHRSYGEELALCQRYYQRLQTIATTKGAVMNVMNRNTVNKYGILHLPVYLRATPSLQVSNIGDCYVYAGGSGNPATAVNLVTFSGASMELYWTTNAAGSVGDGGWVRINYSGWFALDSEL